MCVCTYIIYVLLLSVCTFYTERGVYVYVIGSEKTTLIAHGCIIE